MYIVGKASDIKKFLQEKTGKYKTFRELLDSEKKYENIKVDTIYS